jgi:hypothetical protein
VAEAAPAPRKEPHDAERGRRRDRERAQPEAEGDVLGFGAAMPDFMRLPTRKPTRGSRTDDEAA